MPFVPLQKNGNPCPLTQAHLISSMKPLLLLSTENINYLVEEESSLLIVTISQRGKFDSVASSYATKTVNFN